MEKIYDELVVEPEGEGDVSDDSVFMLACWVDSGNCSLNGKYRGRVGRTVNSF